jgi:hypothetical protein
LSPGIDCSTLRDASKAHSLPLMCIGCLLLWHWSWCFTLRSIVRSHLIRYSQSRDYKGLLPVK